MPRLRADISGKRLREMVEAWGYACDEAGDGEVAWELLQACPYDLVLLDLHLPRLDGLALAGRVVLALDGSVGQQDSHGRS